MAQYNFNPSNNNVTKQKTDYKVKFFNLKNDHDEAIVRFNYATLDDIKHDIRTIHAVKDGNFTRKVDCNRESEQPIDACPFCKAGIRLDNRFFVKLIYYTQNEQGVLAQAAVWDRPVSLASELSSYLGEYGDLRNTIFKIKRNGAAGDKKTTYSIIPANAAVYKPEIYKPDFSGFDNFSLKNHFYFEKTADEMNTYLTTKKFPVREKQTQQMTEQQPVVLQQPTQPVVVQPQTVVNTQPVFNPQTPVYSVPDVGVPAQQESRPRRYSY